MPIHLFFLSFWLMVASTVFAQSGAYQPTYVVQAGDTLSRIASRLNVTVVELATINNLSDPNALEVGQEIVIPGAQTWPQTFAAPFESVTLEPPVTKQGRVQLLSIRLESGASLRKVTYLDASLPVMVSETGFEVLLPTPVLQVLGQVDILLEVEKAGLSSSLALPIMVRDGGFEREEIWLTAESSNLLDPTITSKENALVESICTFDTVKRWRGTFRYPVDKPVFTSDFGTVRSYNGGPYSSFHRGLDFRGDVTTPVYAAADGVIVLSAALQVRGNTIFINHGLGVCTGYVHLSQRLVDDGHMVKAGDMIGYVGDTGMVTGAHLHWEVRVGSIAVEPRQWVEESFAKLE